MSKFFIGQTVFDIKNGRIGRIINIHNTRCLIQFDRYIWWCEENNLSSDFQNYHSLLSLNKT